MDRGHGIVAAAVVLSVAFVFATPAPTRAVQKDPPAGRAGGKAAAPARSPSLESLIAELKREYAAYVKDPDAAPLRTECDYFIDHPQDVPAVALLAAIEKPMPGDARQGAYVKWQLLSGLPEALDAAAVQRLLKAYQKAPMPAPRYGFSPQEKRKLDGALAGARPQDDVQLTARLEEAVARGYGADAPVTAYRDELYRRLPVGRDKFFAGLRDAAERTSVAAQKWDLVELLVEDLQGWALSGDAARPQVRELAELVGKLRFRESAPYYASAGVRKGKLAWVAKTDTLFSKKKLADLHRLLLEAAGMAPPADAAADGPGDNGRGAAKGKPAGGGGRGGAGAGGDTNADGAGAKGARGGDDAAADPGNDAGGGDR